MTAALGCIAAACLMLADPPPAETDAAVSSGRQALDRSWGRTYPWYDATNDSIRRIDVRPRRTFSAPPWLYTLFEWVAWIGVAAILAGLAYFLIRAYLVRRRQRKPGAIGTDDDHRQDERRLVEALPAGASRDPSDLLGEAARHYQNGNYREAIICLFSHELVELDKYNLIRLAKGKTNRQYVRELGRRATLRDLVRQTMIAFEDVFFGNIDIDRFRFERCWDRLEEFEELVGRGQ